jgi:hypothetical protein
MKNINIKTLKFRPHLVKEILEGKKWVTWRLFDDKDLKKGDRLEFVNWETGEKFARAEITDARSKKLGEITEEDFAGHEKFENNEEMIKTYKKYYGDRVSSDTIVKIIEFKLI